MNDTLYSGCVVKSSVETLLKDNSDDWFYCGWHRVDSGNLDIYFGEQLGVCFWLARVIFHRPGNPNTGYGGVVAP